ncbi:UNVERIFIED_CONTAM: hypothetical protein K2H54_060901 [Gekko kuhli]
MKTLAQIDRKGRACAVFTSISIKSDNQPCCPSSPKKGLRILSKKLLRTPSRAFLQNYTSQVPQSSMGGSATGKAVSSWPKFEVQIHPALFPPLILLPKTYNFWDFSAHFTATHRLVM